MRKQQTPFHDRLAEVIRSASFDTNGKRWDTTAAAIRAAYDNGELFERDFTGEGLNE